MLDRFYAARPDRSLLVPGFPGRDGPHDVRGSGPAPPLVRPSRAWPESLHVELPDSWSKKRLDVPIPPEFARLWVDEEA